MTIPFIVALAWIYVVLMMAISETGIVAGVMTFLLYGVLPLSILLYVMGAPQRRRRIRAREEAARQAAVATQTQAANTKTESNID